MLIMKTTMMTASRRLREGVQEVCVRNDGEAEEGRDNALEEAIEAEGHADHEDHDGDLDHGDDAARPCALKACTVAAAALRWLMARGVLARPCALKACTVAAAALRWLVGRSANQPSIRMQEWGGPLPAA